MAKKISASFSINDLSKNKSQSEDSFKIPFEIAKAEEATDNISNANTYYKSDRAGQSERTEKTKLFNLEKNFMNNNNTNVNNVNNTATNVSNNNLIGENINNDNTDLLAKNSNLVKKLSSRQLLLRRHSSYVKKRMREMKVFQLENINKSNLLKMITYDLNKEKNNKDISSYFITHNILLLIQWFVNNATKRKIVLINYYSLLLLCAFTNFL